MNKFELSGTMIFYAENIDDAFEKLSQQFHKIAIDGLDGDDGFTTHPGTDIHIRPINDD